MSLLCDCSCVDPCPLNKIGMTERCSLSSIAQHFNCPENEALKKLHKWRPEGMRVIHNRFQKFREQNGPIEISIVEANRP